MVESDSNLLEDIWHPNIKFDPLVSVEEPEAGSKVSVSKDGSVEMSRSGQYTFSCDLNLMYFPFDRHKCVVISF